MIILEKGYNDKDGEAWVVVGFSDKTLKAARDVERMRQNRPENIVEPDNLGQQPSETKRAKQKDW